MVLQLMLLFSVLATWLSTLWLSFAADQYYKGCINYSSLFEILIFVFFIVYLFPVLLFSTLYYFSFHFIWTSFDINITTSWKGFLDYYFLPPFLSNKLILGQNFSISPAVLALSSMLKYGIVLYILSSMYFLIFTGIHFMKHISLFFIFQTYGDF